MQCVCVCRIHFSQVFIVTSSVAAEHPLASQGCMVSAKRVLAVDEFCPEGTNLVIC